MCAVSRMRFFSARVVFGASVVAHLPLIQLDPVCQVNNDPPTLTIVPAKQRWNTPEVLSIRPRLPQCGGNVNGLAPFDLNVDVRDA